MQDPPSPRRPLLFTAIFCSGFAGLMHEIVWSKMLVSLTGTTAHAQVVVLGVFMGGLALGAYLFGRSADRRARPLLAYARLEIAIALYGLVLPFVLWAAEGLYDSLARRFLEEQGALFALRFSLSVACTLLPAVWMGGTLPLMARFLIERVETTRSGVAGLYALNNLGAVLGVGAAGFWTLGAFGIYASLGIASAVNLLAAWIALAAEKHAERAVAAGGPRAAQRSSAHEARDTAGPRDARTTTEARGEHAPIEDGFEADPTRPELEPSPLVFAEAAEAPPAERVRADHPPARPAPPLERYSDLQYRATLAALFASGFAAMGYEVVFTRVIALSFGSSTYSFSVMLMSFITGIGIGSAIVARLRVERPLWLFAASQLLAAVALVATTPLVARLPYWIGLLRISLESESSNFLLYEAGKAGLILLFLLLPTVCIGFGFPLVAQIQARGPERVGSAVGSTYAWNTVGNVLGVALTGLVLLPRLGLAGAFHANLALTVASSAIVLAVAPNPPLARRAGAALGGAAALALYAILGTGWVEPIARSVGHLRMREGPDELASATQRSNHPASSFASWQKAFVKRAEDFQQYHFAEDSNATVVAFGDESGVVLAVNSKPDATSFSDPRDSDITTQMLLAHLPMLFARDTRSVLVIGHGSGITAGSTMLHGAERGDIVEISSGVLAADALFAEANQRVLSDPRVRVWQEDGRTFLRTAPWSWDAIVSEPSNPWIAGIGGLFTRECFEEVQARLNPGGVFCLWFHIYEQSDESVQLVLRTLAEVFPHRLVFQVLLDGDVIVLASATPLEPDFARMEACFERPELRRDFARMHVFQLASLAMFHAIPEADFARLLGPGPLNTDQHQRLEYLAPKAHFANAFSDLVWRNHDLARSIRKPGTNLLDRYALWRAAAGDPLSREELQGVLRRVRTSLDPGDASALIEAIDHRIGEAPMRTAAAKLVARGADPDPATVAYLEATDRGTDAFNANQLERAMRWWRHANRLEPTRPSAIANLALGLDRSGQRQEALRLLQDGLNANPDSVLLLQRAAMILEAAGNVPQALALLDRANALRPDDAETMLAHGRLLYKAQQVGRAIDCYQRLFDLDPKQWQAAVALVQMLAATPNGAPRASLVLEQALRVHPGVPELQQLRKALRGP